MPGRPELVERNRRIVLMRNNRMTLREIAAAFGISIVRVHVICRREQERRSAQCARAASDRCSS